MSQILSLGLFGPEMAWLSARTPGSAAECRGKLMALMIKEKYAKDYEVQRYCL